MQLSIVSLSWSRWPLRCLPTLTLYGFLTPFRHALFCSRFTSSISVGTDEETTWLNSLFNCYKAGENVTQAYPFFSNISSNVFLTSNTSSSQAPKRKVGKGLPYPILLVLGSFRSSLACGSLGYGILSHMHAIRDATEFCSPAFLSWKIQDSFLFFSCAKWIFISFCCCFLAPKHFLLNVPSS